MIPVEAPQRRTERALGRLGVVPVECEPPRNRLDANRRTPTRFCTTDEKVEQTPEGDSGAAAGGGCCNPVPEEPVRSSARLRGCETLLAAATARCRGEVGPV